jgi:ribosomal subunit interface protein
MKVNIVGRHLDVSPMHERHARDKFGKLDRYFAGIQHAEVVLDVDGHGQARAFKVEASVVLGHGAKLIGKAQADDMMAAIDLTESKLEKQIRRFHNRLKTRRNRARPDIAGAAPAGEDEATYEQVVREMLDDEEE